MSLDQKLTESSLVRQLAKLSGERESWRKLLDRRAGSAKQLESMVAQVAGLDLSAKGLQPFALTVSEQLKAFGPGSATATAFSEWQETQRLQQESIQKMLEPLGDLRKAFQLSHSARAIVDQWRDGEALQRQIQDVLKASHLTQVIEESRVHTRKILESIEASTRIGSYLKEFEQINKAWQVPGELLGAMGSLRELQDRFGRLTLPAMDWGSAAAVASLIGPEGLEEQLSRLGLQPDGSLDLTAAETADNGILSRKQSDLATILSLLVGVVSLWFSVQALFFPPQQDNQAPVNEELLARQARQLESLNALIERVLEQAAADHAQKFVVRDRPATVRSKPKPGSSIEWKLMPREVVTLVESQGKWIKVEYYHWLHQEYRTGWVLKKYLQRVPANFGTE